MNTPRTPKRFKFSDNSDFDGSWMQGCASIPVLIQLGIITSYWSHVEEAMLHPYQELSGMTDPHTAAIAFKSILSVRARLAVIRNLLENSFSNKDKDIWYDEFVTRMSKLISTRNNYTHGTWYTEAKTNRVILAPTEGESFEDFNFAREVTEGELKAFVTELGAFTRWVSVHKFKGIHAGEDYEREAPPRSLQPPSDEPI